MRSGHTLIRSLCQGPGTGWMQSTYASFTQGRKMHGTKRIQTQWHMLSTHNPNARSLTYAHTGPSPMTWTLVPAQPIRARTVCTHKAAASVVTIGPAGDSALSPSVSPLCLVQRPPFFSLAGTDFYGTHSLCVVAQQITYKGPIDLDHTLVLAFQAPTGQRNEGARCWRRKEKSSGCE